jgi:hypothetical protein
MNLPAKIYTETDLDRARRRGRWAGWVQGAGAVIVAGIVLNVLGWIPTVLVVGAVGYLAYKLLSKAPKDDPSGG